MLCLSMLKLVTLLQTSSLPQYTKYSLSIFLPLALKYIECFYTNTQCMMQNLKLHATLNGYVSNSNYVFVHLTKFPLLLKKVYYVNYICLF